MSGWKGWPEEKTYQRRGYWQKNCTGGEFKESSEGVIRRIAKPNGGEGRDANENLFSKQVKTLYRLASYFPHCFPESCELL